RAACRSQRQEPVARTAAAGPRPGTGSHADGGGRRAHRSGWRRPHGHHGRAGHVDHLHHRRQRGHRRAVPRGRAGEGAVGLRADGGVLWDARLSPPGAGPAQRCPIHPLRPDCPLCHDGLMRGIILAGGTGSRLHPLTIGVSKQLMPVYDKPMIYYPLSTLMLAGIRDILVITTPEDQAAFQRVLGDGSRFGVHLQYTIQPSPDGLAQAFVLAERFLDGDRAALVLGDNLFYGTGMGAQLRRYREVDGAAVFGYWVSDPRAYGVVEMGPGGRALSLVEKPEHPRSHLAVPGLYFYDASVVERAKALLPSSRGELEITDLNDTYLQEGTLQVEVLTRGTAWLDTGTFDDLAAAGEFIRTVQQRQGLSVGSPEEVGWRMGYLSDEELRERAQQLVKSGYGSYLLDLLERETTLVGAPS